MQISYCKLYRDKARDESDDDDDDDDDHDDDDEKKQQQQLRPGCLRRSAYASGII